MFLAEGPCSANLKVDKLEYRHIKFIVLNNSQVSNSFHIPELYTSPFPRRCKLCPHFGGLINNIIWPTMFCFDVEIYEDIAQHIAPHIAL